MAEVIKPKPKPSPDFLQHLEALKDIAAARETSAVWRNEAKYHVEVDGSLPYLPLVPLSDIHIGSLAVDNEALLEYLNYIKNYPVYTVILGDFADMFMPTKHPQGMLSTSVTPQDQMMVCRRILEYIGPEKVLGIVEDPSHNGWAMSQAGIDSYSWITLDMDIPLLLGGSTLDLTVSNAKQMQHYTTLLFHAIDRYNSSLNQTNAGKRALQLHSPADVVISGHRHIYAQEKTVMHDKKVQVVQLGTMKTNGDRFGTGRGMFPSPQVGFPTLFYDCRRKNVEIIENLDTAKEFIDGMQALTKTRAVALLSHGRK